MSTLQVNFYFPSLSYKAIKFDNQEDPKTETLLILNQYNP